MENSTGSVKQIAQLIFSKPPTSNLSLTLDEADNEYVFEILLNIFLEGLMIKNYISFDKSNFGSLNITTDQFIELNQYFNSFGFKINCDQIEFNEYIGLTNETYLNRYCSIHINENQGYYFGINLNFYKQLGFDFNAHNNLNKYVATYITSNNNSNDKIVYFISFAYNIS